MTTAPENLLNQHTKRRIPTSSSTSSTLFPSKGSLGSSFRYEKSRPRARTLHSTTLSKGHTSRASLSSSCPSSTKLGSTDAGHHRISIASRGSVAGPKSASSRISLERIQEEGISMIMKKEHAGHVCSRDSCSSTSSSSSSSSTLAPTTTGTLKRSGGISRRKEEEGHQQYVADGSEPNSSSTTLLSSSSNGGQQDVNTNADTRGAHRSAVSTGSSSSPSCRPDMGTTVALATGPSTTTTATATATTTASTTTTTTPRRIHIAPLRLVNSNVAGVTPTSASNTAINLTSSWPSSGLPLSSSSSLLSSQPVHRFDRNIINTTAATSQPRTVSMSSSSSAAGGGPMMMMMMSGQHGCRPNMMMSSGDSIPASAPTASSSSWPSIYQQQQQIKSAAAAQFLPSISSAKIPLGQQHDLSITDTIETKRRRTSDFTVMRVVHHPSPPSSSYSFGERRELSRSTPASFLPSNGTGHNVGGYTGKYHGYTSPAVGDVKVQQHQQHHHRDSIGWPSTGSHPHQQRAPHPTYTHLPTSPAYRFPSIPTTATHHHHSHQSSSSSSSIWHIGTSPPLSESFLPYDSMRGSLKRKASLGLVESSSNSTHRRRRSSGEMTVGSGSARRGSSGNSLVNSRGHNRRNSQGGDKLPPLIRPYQSSEAHSPGTSSNYETIKAQGCESQQMSMPSIVPKVEEDEDHHHLASPSASAIAGTAIQDDAALLAVVLEEDQRVVVAVANNAEVELEEGGIGDIDIEIDDDNNNNNEDNNTSAMRIRSSSVLLGSLDEDEASDSLRDHTHPLSISTLSTAVASPPPPRPLSAVLEVSFEGEASSDSSSGLNGQSEQRTASGNKKKSTSSPSSSLSDRSIRPRALSLPVLTSEVAMSTGGGAAAGGSGGHRQHHHHHQRVSPYKRVSRSVGPLASSSSSSSTTKSAMTKHRDSTSTTTSSSMSNILNPAATNTATTSSPASQLSPIIGLPSPTTPVEAASLQRSLELREEQRKLIDERRRAAAGGDTSTKTTTTTTTPAVAAASPTMSVASPRSSSSMSTSVIPASSLSRIPILKQHASTTGSGFRAGSIERLERPSSRLASRRGHAAQEKVANLIVSTPAAMTFSEPKLPPIPLTAPIQRFNPSHHQKHGHSQSSHQLGSPSLLFKPSISENTLLPFPKFPNTEANTSTITTTTPQLPPSHPLQITSSSEGRGMVHNEARLTPTAAVETAPSTSTNLPSNFLSHRRATISQGIDTTSSSALPFSGYATVPPRRGFPLTASGTAASTATSLGSSNPPLHNRQRSMQLPPPLASSSKQRHHIPPPAMQAHLHSAPIFGSSSSGTYSMHTQPSTITSTQYYSPPRQAGSSREILTGNQLQIPSAAGPIQQQEQQLQSLNHPATRELILNMFEQFYDSLVLDNLEQQDQKMNLLKEELGDYLLSRIESKFNQDSEIEIFKRSEWENKMDKRFEDFRKTLSSELLFLEKRIDSIEKIHRRIGPNTSRRRGDDGTHNMIMDPSGSLNIGTTSRKRSAEEMEEDDSDYYEEDPYSSTTSNTTMTNTSSGGDGKGKGKTKGKGKRRFTTPPELVNLTKRVEVLEAHASSSSSASASVSPRQGDTTVTGPSTTSHHQHHQSETAYTTTFRPISSLRGT